MPKDTRRPSLPLLLPPFLPTFGTCLFAVPSLVNILLVTSKSTDHRCVYSSDMIYIYFQDIFDSSNMKYILACHSCKSIPCSVPALTASVFALLICLAHHRILTENVCLCCYNTPWRTLALTISCEE